MDDKRTFLWTLPAAMPGRDARVLGLTAAVLLCEALGPSAMLLWPGHIECGGRSAALVRFGTREGELCVECRWEPDFGDAVDEASVRAAWEALAAGFPENRESLMQRYCSRCRTLMKYVDTVYRGMPVYGFAFAVDKYGGLMVMTQISRTVVTVYDAEAPLAVDEPQQPEIPAMPRV